MSDLTSERRQSTGWTGYAACVWSVLFALPHVYWAAGGTAGFDGREMSGVLIAINLVAIVLSVIAAIVALATVQRWGERVPDRLLQSAIWSACLLLTLRGGAGLIQTIVGQGEQSTLVMIFEPTFLIGGALFGALGIAFLREARTNRQSHG